MNVQIMRPATGQERTTNPLRPTFLVDVVGQQRAKQLVARAIQSAHERVEPLDHMLLVGRSGTGKSTFSHVVANELGVDVYEVEAPVSHDTLLELRTTMMPGDILKIEEIHQQAIMDRRGRSSATQPEVLYAVMEDRVLTTATGVLPFPAITVIGTTTDEGLLPDAFINRFPLRPRVDPYEQSELEHIARANAAALSLEIDTSACIVFARACGGVPRHINNFVRNAAMLAHHGQCITKDVALEVLALNDITVDGLSADMQAMLTFLLTRARHERDDGDVKYQASVSTIATAIGKSRDSKAITLRVEPLLIERGYVQVTHGGRRLTDAGIARANELIA
jgi:Holliday junction DNA helicase RuvB